jgi:TolB-like protein
MIALPVPKPVCYELADLTIDFEQRRVKRGEQAIALGKLTFDMLGALIESAPALVSREELARRVWNGRYVSPETIIQRVKLLRRALSDDAGAPRYVDGVHGQGYRLVPDVKPLANGHGKPALAVLPFEVLSRDPDDALFAAGLHDELLSHLAGLPSVDVLARTTVKRYADTTLPISEIAADLGATVVMEGSVRSSDKRVRITAQFIDGRTSAHLWAQIHECACDDDVLDVQTRIAREIVAGFEGATRGMCS